MESFLKNKKKIFFFWIDIVFHPLNGVCMFYLFHIVTCAYIDNDIFVIGERAGDVEGLSKRNENLFACKHKKERFVM